MEDEDDFELEAKMQQVQVLQRAALIDLKLGSINQVQSHASGLVFASKQGISVFDTRQH
jgi:hypothetical protein